MGVWEPGGQAEPWVHCGARVEAPGPRTQSLPCGPHLSAARSEPGALVGVFLASLGFWGFLAAPFPVLMGQNQVLGEESPSGWEAVANSSALRGLHVP